MRLSLILFIMGTLFITSGYLNQIDPGCSTGDTNIKIVSRSVYDQIYHDSILSKGNK